jgi:hypothetical protein
LVKPACFLETYSNRVGKYFSRVGFFKLYSNRLGFRVGFQNPTLIEYGFRVEFENLLFIRAFASILDCKKRAERRAKARGIVVKEELDLKSLLLELWQQNQRTREPNLR